MKKFHPARIITLIGVFVVIVFLGALLFLNQIKSEIFELAALYGYPAIFIITMIVETMAQPIGPEISIIAGKIIQLNMLYVSLIVVISSSIASLINYRVGKLFYPKLCADKSCKKYFDSYKRYGKYGLLISALGPVPYVPFCWFSGAFGLRMWKFFYFGILPRILRIIFVSYIISLIL